MTKFEIWPPDKVVHDYTDVTPLWPELADKWKVLEFDDRYMFVDEVYAFDTEKEAQEFLVVKLLES